MNPITLRALNPSTAALRLACSLALLNLVPAAWAGGVVTNLTDANLRAAMAGGGLVTFAVEGTITLTNTLTNEFNTVIDATGHNISLGMADPGCCWYRPVLCIPTNTSLRLIGLTIDNANEGGFGTGGILNDGGTLNLVGVTLQNIALGVFGLAQGGALANMGGWVDATNCLFSHNSAWSGTWDSLQGAQGGAVANILGHFTAQNCTFDSNAAWGNREYDPAPGDNGTWGFGGAIYNTGRLELRDCTLSHNSAAGAAGVSGVGGYTGFNNDGRSGGSGGSGLGGAVYSSGPAYLINCTVTGNQARGADGAPGGNGGKGSSSGGNGGAGGNGGSGMGAIYATNGLAMTNCTFAFNVASSGQGAPGGAGGSSSMPPPHGHNGYPGPAGTNGVAYGGLVTTGAGLVNTILAGNSPNGNCYGPVIDYGHNLSSDVTFTAPSSLNNTDPKLDALAQNGGLTATLALLPSSPAIDAGDTASAPPTDQRGLPRPCGRAADIGAYEYYEPTEFAFTVDNGAIAITGYNGTDAAVTVPGTINGLPVTSIASAAFQNRSSLTRVTIPSSVTNIGNAAFAGCANLTSVYFEGNAPGIGSGVFASDNNATVYIQAGTAGWGSTYGGQPAALWAMPSILTPPWTQTAEAGSSVQFRVRANGDPAVGFRWYFNGTNSLTSTNRILQLTNTQASNAGTYTVVAVNAGASVASAPAVLSVIPSVPRRMVPALTLTSTIGTALNLESRDALDFSGAWTAFDSVSLTSTSQWYFDVRTPLSPQGFYRARTTDPLNPPSPLDLHMVPAITLSGIPGGSIRLDAINQIGPTDAWWTLDTVTLTNTTQLYFDTSTIGQPPRLWRTKALNVVTSLADSGSGSLRQTIANAGPGDTIVFGINGTIHLTSGALSIGKDISILGPGASVLAISGNNTNRIFTISNRVNVFISDLTLRDGRARDGADEGVSPGYSPAEPGGAITNAGSLTLWNCVLANNRAGDGGVNYAGGYSENGGAGGAIYSTGALCASNCVFAGNASGSGGGVYSGYTWSGGAGGDGGAVWSLGPVSMVNCTVSSNTCGRGPGGGGLDGGFGGWGGRGGGIYAAGTLCLLASTVSSNCTGAGGDGGGAINPAPGGGGGGSGGSGGGIYVGGALLATNSTLSANSCGNGGRGGSGEHAGSGGDGGSGGAVYCASGATNIAVNSCTIVGNACGVAGQSGSGQQVLPPASNGSGDGICLSSSALLGGFLNNIVALGTWRTQDVAGVFNSLGHNLIGATTGSTGFTAAGDLVGSATSPLDPLVGRLTNNGGPTLTMALLPGSPAIDTGSDSGAPATDQRGFARPYGAAVDIGAYEYGASQPLFQ